MLARNFEFYVRNESTQQIPINGVTISLELWRFDANGAKIIEPPQVLQNASPIADNSSGIIGGSVDGSSHVGGHFTLQYNALTGATGMVELYLRILGADQNTSRVSQLTDITITKTDGREI